MTPTSGRRVDGLGPVLRWLGDLDARSPVPLYEQIAARLRAAVAGGGLGPGAALPSVRQLASELRVNPATVVQAYRSLEAEGFAEMRQGSGSYVCDLEGQRLERERQAQARRLARDVLAQGARLGVSARELRDAINDLVKERRG